jgi:hypothetical protein
VPGDGVLARQRGPGAWQVLLRQFTSPLIYALLASAAAFALCEVLDGVVCWPWWCSMRESAPCRSTGPVEPSRSSVCLDDGVPGEQCQPAQ